MNLITGRVGLYWSDTKNAQSLLLLKPLLPITDITAGENLHLYAKPGTSSIGICLAFFIEKIYLILRINVHEFQNPLFEKFIISLLKSVHPRNIQVFRKP